MGLQEAGVAATAKHYPGLGTTGMQNTDEAVVRVGTPAGELSRRARPFRRLADDGVRLVMVSNAIYTALDPAAPAVLSRRIVAGRLRSFFKGVIISDALEVPALRRYGNRVSVMASNAGVDVLLYTSTNAGGAFDALLSAHRRGDLSAHRLTASYERIMALKQRRRRRAPSRGSAGRDLGKVDFMAPEPDRRACCEKRSHGERFSQHGRCAACRGVASARTDVSRWDACCSNC